MDLSWSQKTIGVGVGSLVLGAALGSGVRKAFNKNDITNILENSSLCAESKILNGEKPNTNIEQFNECVKSSIKTAPEDLKSILGLKEDSVNEQRLKLNKKEQN